MTAKHPDTKLKLTQIKYCKSLISVNPSSKFTMETSDREILLLDILVKRNDEKT